VLPKQLLYQGGKTNDGDFFKSQLKAPSMFFIPGRFGGHFGEPEEHRTLPESRGALAWKVAALGLLESGTDFQPSSSCAWRATVVSEFVEDRHEYSAETRLKWRRALLHKVSSPDAVAIFLSLSLPPSPHMTLFDMSDARAQLHRTAPGAASFQALA